MKEFKGSRQPLQSGALSKVVFAGKLIVFLATFGFVYPTLFVD